MKTITARLLLLALAAGYAVAQEPRPLPNMVELLRGVAKNQKALEEARERYTCHVAIEETNVDGKGTVKSTTVKEYDVAYVGGRQLGKLTAVGGKPLSASEKRKEDERYDREYKKRKAERPSETTRADVRLSDFLEANRFTNPRRETMNDHEVVAADFGPNPDYKPRNLGTRIAHSLVGTIWIDEGSLEVTRLEGKVDTSVRVGAGVVGALDAGSRVTFEQAKINGEIWLPVYTEAHISGRLLFIHARANQTARFSDYRKFQADSKIVGVEIRDETNETK